jgi:hypothetical protein
MLLLLVAASEQTSEHVPARPMTWPPAGGCGTGRSATLQGACCAATRVTAASSSQRPPSSRLPLPHPPTKSSGAVGAALAGRRARLFVVDVESDSAHRGRSLFVTGQVGGVVVALRISGQA